MKKYYIIFLFLFRNGIFQTYAQETPIKHKVSKGETIDIIAKNYKVSASELFQLNPNLADGIKEDDIIAIPKTKIWNNKDQDLDPIYHLVQPRETKFGLSKRYNISIEELERQNPHIVDMLMAGHELKIQPKAVKNNIDSRSTSDNASQNGDYTAYLVQPGETLWGIARRYKITVSELIDINRSVLGAVLQSGQTLSVPVKKSNPVQASDSNYEQHIVEAGETKYGLSKRYGVSIDQLEDLNPHIVKMLRTGQQVSIPGTAASKPVAKQQIIKEEPKKAAEKPIVEKPIAEQPKVQSEANAPVSMASYEVKPKETLYGLSKMVGLSEERLIELNPEVGNGLKAGMILKIPSENASRIAETKVAGPTDNQQAGLLQSIKKGTQKEIAFLMPFTEEKYLDFIKSQKTNETTADLEFYAGASMAMDSLKKSNVMISSKVFEIQSQGTTEEDFSNLTTNNIQNYKAVFCTSGSYASEKLGDYLSKNKIPMIISDTKNPSTSFPTTYNSLISNAQLKKMILDYVASKKGNIIIVNDPVRKESKNYITQNYPEARFVKIDGNGIFDSESLKGLLSTSKKNYIVLDTDKAGLILTATNSLLKYSKEYDVQIALLEPKENIKGEELSEMRFKALKMIYPSFYKPTSTKQLTKFKKDFKLKYGFEPTNEAINGFDVTFDALVRLFQDKDFEVLAQENITEQLKLTFKYVKDLEGGYVNSAGYILQYDEDSDARIVN